MPVKTKSSLNGHNKIAPIVNVEVVELPRPNIQEMTIRVIGTSPLIMNKWSEKAKQEMRDKQQKKAVTERKAKDPEADYKNSIYRDKDDDYAFPAIGFKAAAVTACSQQPNLTKVFARGAFHVVGEFVKIKGQPKMREDMVKVGMGIADLRYRAEFTEWSAEILIQYNAGVISKAQVLNLFQLAGFAVGVGEWRPERDGEMGRFRIAEDKE